MTNEAFAAFYRAEFDGQVRWAWLMLGSAERAHDVVQDSFAAVYQRFDDIAEPGPYLNRVVLNGCRAEGRRSSRETIVELDPDPIPFEGEAVEMAELLLTLPFVPRAAIVLKFYEGLTEAEIADLLGLRPGSVGPAVTRGLRKLRGVLS
ncbi:MAG: SigE family RNA polymerase sigma factor [Actinomycetia bacterium]|nr:SigE family RNA polymerase sigma factor [Actinomycetes bacterium]